MKIKSVRRWIAGLEVRRSVAALTTVCLALAGGFAVAAITGTTASAATGPDAVCPESTIQTATTTTAAPTSTSPSTEATCIPINPAPIEGPVAQVVTSAEQTAQDVVSNPTAEPSLPDLEGLPTVEGQGYDTVAAPADTAVAAAVPINVADAYDEGKISYAQAASEALSFCLFGYIHQRSFPSYNFRWGFQFDCGISPAYAVRVDELEARLSTPKGTPEGVTESPYTGLTTYVGSAQAVWTGDDGLTAHNINFALMLHSSVGWVEPPYTRGKFVCDSGEGATELDCSGIATFR